MKHLFTLLLLVLAFAAGAHADDKNDGRSRSDRARWMEEMQQHQNDYIAKELDLTAKQKADFLPVYNKMRSEIFSASRAAREKASEVRKKGDAATDADYEAAIQAYLTSRTREASIIQSYYKKFGHILSKKQLYKLDGAERKFDRMLMQHRPGKGNGKGNGQGQNQNRGKSRERRDKR